MKVGEDYTKWGNYQLKIYPVVIYDGNEITSIDSEVYNILNINFLPDCRVH